MKKGFTLIELLIVIAILAILATTVVLTLNPAQLLAETRDGQRISDLGTIQSAISLYLASVANPKLSFRGSCAAQCFSHNSDVTQAGCAGAGTARHSSTAGGGATKDAVASTTLSRAVDGLGWVPVEFSAISGGAPFAIVPIDPSNTSTYFYTYACNEPTKTFELDAKMESTRYAQTGSGDVESKDGGDIDTLYEVGNDPNLNQ